MVVGLPILQEKGHKKTTVERHPEDHSMRSQKAPVAEGKDKAKEMEKARRARAIGRAKDQANRLSWHGSSDGVATTMM